MDESTASAVPSEPVLADVVPPVGSDDDPQPRPANSSASGNGGFSAEPCQDNSRWRGIAVLPPLIVLADITIYRGHGFAGYALLFALAPLLLLLGAPRPRFRYAVWMVGAMLMLLAAKLLWCGSLLQVVAGFALLAAFAAALSGLRPYVLDVLAYAIQTLPAGSKNLLDHVQFSGEAAPRVLRLRLLNVVLPLVAILVFGSLFILANPDLAVAFKETLQDAFTSLQTWIAALDLSSREVVFWFFVAWIAMGMLRPIMRRSILDRFSADGTDVSDRPAGSARSLLYVPFRNTLVALIVLFAAYLVFESATLWFREFPEGFYYAGYAHEGAAWLTGALALATGVLSLIFRGSVLRDPRLPQLRRLTWLWSLENVLLAIAVYNRLFIYIHFNGMTRMRTVGLFGMSVVLVGFVLVVWKVARQRDFVWLLRRQLWALAVTVYLFAITPVDVVVHAYNVRQILAGDPAPSVQISVHPIDSAGILVLPPLVTCDDEIIREGIRAMLADRYLNAKAEAGQRASHGWTTRQIADETLLSHLGNLRHYWEAYADPQKRREALERFDQYAYQWY